jgi:hypothetical protein
VSEKAGDERIYRISDKPASTAKGKTNTARKAGEAHERAITRSPSDRG